MSPAALSKPAARDSERLPGAVGLLHGYACDRRINDYKIRIVGGLEHKLYIARLEYDLRLALVFTSPSENTQLLPRRYREWETFGVTHSLPGIQAGRP